MYFITLKLSSEVHTIGIGVIKGKFHICCKYNEFFTIVMLKNFFAYHNQQVYKISFLREEFLKNMYTCYNKLP